MTTIRDRIKGVLSGQAAGDALGAGYETGRPSNGKAAMIGGGYGFEPYEWTDDTAQAIIVARAKCDPLDVAEGLLDWFWGSPKDVGVHTVRLLSQVRDPGDLLVISREFAAELASRPRPRGWDPGMANGSLMRCGPTCLPFLGDEVRIAERARTISDLTHAEPYAGDSCTVWSVLIGRAVTEGRLDLPRDVRDIIGAWIPEDRRAFWLDLVGQALDVTPPGPRNGSAVGAFRCALWAVAHGEDLVDTLQLAIGEGGDCDTTAAIAGSLAGAVYGASAVPAAWRRKLHGWPGLVCADLERIALEAAGY